MTPIADRYRRLADAMAAKIAAVPPERWESPSPCREWTARDIVRHLVDVQGVFLGLVGRELGSIPSVDRDPLAAWKAAAARVLTDLEDPAVAGLSFDGQMGPRTFEDAIDQLVSFDLLVHGWDLARATGLDDTMDPAEVDRGLAALATMGDSLASSGLFGPPVATTGEADAQTRLLAGLGRDARAISPEV